MQTYYTELTVQNPNKTLWSINNNYICVYKYNTYCIVKWWPTTAIIFLFLSPSLKKRLATTGIVDRYQSLFLKSDN